MIDVFYENTNYFDMMGSIAKSVKGNTRTII